VLAQLLVELPDRDVRIDQPAMEWREGKNATLPYN
jgi:hypothetical protein